MAVQTSINQRNHIHNKNDNNRYHHMNEYDEEIDETEGDLIENYLYLTQRCGVLRHSPTTSAINTLQQQQHKQLNQNVLSRQFSWATEQHNIDYERSLRSSKSRSSLNDYNNNYELDYSQINHISPTIYYNSANDINDDYGDKSFSLVKLFARMKARLKHDKRYRPRSTHELLHEEESQEWLELTKNIRQVLTKALLPDGGYDAAIHQKKFNHHHHHRQNSQKKSHIYDPILSKENEDDDDDAEDDHKININIDDEFNTEGDKEYDEVIRNNFLKCSRGYNYRRSGVCKAVDRQQFQGQLVYIYGVANNILIDENLKASGLG